MTRRPIDFMLRVTLTLASLGACATAAAALTQSEPATSATQELAPRVWVNTSSGVYHCLGSADYGTTKSGEYMPESVARERNHRPARGQVCGPARVWVNTTSSVYHCPGTANYGTTAAGVYMTEDEARAAEARPAGGKACFP